MCLYLRFGLAICLLTASVCDPSFASDWPMYRADAARSGHSPDALPASLELRWVYRTSPPRPAWPSSARITYDFAHQPIVVDDTVVFGSTTRDSVTALDVKDGRRRWQFLTSAPVRFAPAAWRDRVFVACDDGYLYALSLADGSLLWKHRGGPNGRMCLGNERMISRWPARGGPVVLDDAVYYAAGIWPSGGVYLHALNAATGQVVWSNDRTGQLLMPQPHGGAEAHSGVAPQGYLLATKEQLFVPTGRAVPAAFRRESGELDYYRLQENGSIGGSRALIADRFVVNGGCFLQRETGKLAARAGRGVFSVNSHGMLQFTGSKLLAYEWDDIDTHDRKGNPVTYRGLTRRAELDLAEPADGIRRAAHVVEQLPGLSPLFRTGVVFKDTDANVARQTGLERALAQSRPDVERLGGDVGPLQAAVYERTCEVISAGDEAVCGTQKLVSVVDLKERRVRWSHEVDGDAIGLATAGGTLLVSTTNGVLYCFAETSSSGSPGGSTNEPTPSTIVGKTAASIAAEEILRTSGVREGFCLDVGCGDGTLALELVRGSKLYVIGLEADAQQAARARRLLAEAGVYGSRATIHEAALTDGLYPNYFADLIVSSAQLDDATATANPKLLENLQRPNGGVICLGQRGNLQVRRRGALEGTGLWTHQNSNAANTLCSDDLLIRGPLEAAWYRDGVLEIVDRHAQGPAPLYNQAVLVVEGVHGLCGLDAYNGRTRWVYPIDDILADWDGVHHDVGVGDVGSNVCLGDDAVFVRTGPSCLKIDLSTGRKIAEFKTPVGDDAANRNWGYVACVNGVLFGGVLNEEHTVSPRYKNIRLRTESVLLFAMDTDSGKLLWKYEPQHSIRNNAIAIADGRVYLIDRPLAPADRIADPPPDGKHRPPLAPGEHAGGKLVALDARSGEVLWINEKQIWGTQLAVSAPAGVLLMYYQGVKHSFFKLPSEIGGRLAAFATDSGGRLWDREAMYKTRPVINDGVVYAEGGAWDLKTGKSVPWEFRRSYGCGQIAASRHLMLFRSATLGYLDLSRDAGTENFGGIRPSCWFNAIPAGGLVLVPDGSSKCACSYQMRAWLALQPCAADYFSMLQGHVSGDGKPLAGVLVSDGCRVVRTDGDGQYRLPVGDDSGRFVFVTLPRGYWSEDFYVPLGTAIEQRGANFALESVTQSDRFDFVFVADMHLERRDVGGVKLKASLAEIKALQPKPAFLLFQGDICLQSGAGDLYAECCQVADMPARHGAGNHEMILGHENPRDDFQERFGPTYYSFDWGPVHCIVLDGNKPIPGETGWQAVHGAVEGSELKWLTADLAAQGEGKPIVVGVHIPIVSSYPERRSTSPKNAPYWEMTNSRLLTDLFSKHGVKLVLQGHMHENERATVGDVEYVASISISGSWWKGGHGFERGVDNCPRGYRIVSVDGNKIAHHYQSTAESRVTRLGEFYGLTEPLTAGKETTFVFNCYDAPNESMAVARIDDGPWQPMPPFAAPSPVTAGLTMPHHFRLAADTTALESGRHTITVRMTMHGGKVVETSSPFLIGR